jgi:hypothetical protein
MSAATLTLQTMTPALFDFDVQAAALKAEEARNADRELCKRFMGRFAGTHDSNRPARTITFAEFSAAAARLNTGI